MAEYTLDSLRRKYGGFHAPTVQITLGGVDLAAKGWRIRSVWCDTGVREEAGICQITLEDVYDRKNSRFGCDGFLVRGMVAEVRLGYLVTEPVFKGFLYEIEYLLDGEQPPQVTLVCMDVKAAMMGCGSLDFSGGQTWKQVLEGLFSGVGRGYAVLTRAPEIPAVLDCPVGYPPEQMDDYAFLTAAARRFGLECFVQKGALLLREQPVSPGVLLSLTPEDGIQRLSVRLRSAGYVKKVRVTGGSDDIRDSVEKKASGEAENPFSIAPASSDPGRLIGARSVELFSASVRDNASAEALAKGQLRLRRTLESELELTLTGLPELAPGYALALDRVSPSCNGSWYLVSVVHEMDSETFRTTVRARRAV